MNIKTSTMPAELMLKGLMEELQRGYCKCCISPYKSEQCVKSQCYKTLSVTMLCLFNTFPVDKEVFCNRCIFKNEQTCNYNCPLVELENMAKRTQE